MPEWSNGLHLKCNGASLAGSNPVSPEDIFCFPRYWNHNMFFLGDPNTLFAIPPEQQTTACYTLGKQDLRTSKIVSTDPKTCSWSSPKEYVIAFSRRWAYPTGECRSGLTGCTWNAMAQASQVRILSRPKIFLLHRLPGKGLRHGLPSSGKFLEKEGDFINRMQINKEIRRLHGPRNLSIHR